MLKINKYKKHSDVYLYIEWNKIDVIKIQYKFLLYMMKEASRVLGDDHYKWMPRVTVGVTR